MSEGLDFLRDYLREDYKERGFYELSFGRSSLVGTKGLVLADLMGPRLDVVEGEIVLKKVEERYRYVIPEKLDSVGFYSPVSPMGKIGYYYATGPWVKMNLDFEVAYRMGGFEEYKDLLDFQTNLLSIYYIVYRRDI